MMYKITTEPYFPIVDWWKKLRWERLRSLKKTAIIEHYRLEYGLLNFVDEFMEQVESVYPLLAEEEAMLRSDLLYDVDTVLNGNQGDIIHFAPVSEDICMWLLPRTVAPVLFQEAQI